MAKINIKGDIIINDFKWFYDWFELESTCPKDVQDIIDAAADDEPLDVYINSPGGIVEAGQEIYTALRGNPRVSIHITGQACSAAGFIAMAGHCDITPVGLLMVHCASIGHVSGNHNDMEQAAAMLKSTDRAIAQAYVDKSGMTLEAAIRMMEKETWLTANQCVELGLADGIMPETAPTAQAAAAIGGIRLTPEMMEQAKAEKKAAEEKEKAEADRRKNILSDLEDFGV